MSDRLQKVEKILRLVSATYQSVRIYTVEHPSAQSSIGMLHEEIKQYTKDHGDLTVAVAEGEFFSGKDVFFELSKHLAEIRGVLVAAKATRIVFSSALTKQELPQFFAVLVKCVDGKAFVDVAAQQRVTLEGIVVSEAGAVPKGGRGASVGRERAVSPSSELAATLYGKIAGEQRAAVDAIADGRSVDVSSLLNFSYDLYHAVQSGRESLFAMMGLRRHDDYTFVHSVNVAVLTVFQAQYLGLDEKMCARLGLAGLLHDTGKTSVKTQILNKQGQLTEDEFRAVKSHAAVGAMALLAAGHADVVLIGAYQHHIGVDLNRSPRPMFIKRQSIAAKIIAIADIYDALRSRRSYKEGMAPDKVYDIMQKEKGRQLDPELTDMFFKHIGIWPVGTLVRLSDGEVAVVKEVNTDDSLAPLVDVWSEKGVPLVQARSCDLKEKDETGVYRVHIAANIAPESDEGKQWVARLYGEKKTDGAEGGI